jgi:hypothetical protein
VPLIQRSNYWIQLRFSFPSSDRGSLDPCKTFLPELSDCQGTPLFPPVMEISKEKPPFTNPDTATVTPSRKQYPSNFLGGIEVFQYYSRNWELRSGLFHDLPTQAPRAAVIRATNSIKAGLYYPPLEPFGRGIRH